MSAALLLASLVLFAGIAFTQEAGQKTFANAQAAGEALYNAAKSEDKAAKSEDKAAVEGVLGASSASIISSGDEVEDKNTRDTFIERYEQMNRWAKEINGEQTLILGAENWPLPIPLKKDAAGVWYFDTKTGVQEILFRRIGRNELAAIRVCRALADAQNEYFSQTHDGDAVKQYAQRFISDPGKQNGLYWKVAEGETESPIGPLVAYAAGQGYGGEHNAPQPFHGYLYRILTERVNAKGAATSFLVGGKMTRGFAMLAFPAEYRNSGVMTFVIDDKGVVYEKDLGQKTADVANSLKAFNPKGWRVVTETQGDDSGD
jgi:Protein of unknown function (DUF2950)